MSLLESGLSVRAALLSPRARGCMPQPDAGCWSTTVKEAKGGWRSAALLPCASCPAVLHWAPVLQLCFDNGPVHGHQSMTVLSHPQAYVLTREDQR